MVNHQAPKGRQRRGPRRRVYQTWQCHRHCRPRGTDPDTNFALRLAIDKAKAANMPAANIQRSIDRIKDKDAAQLQEVLYEGYGPGGVAILVEAATDNINRTYPEVKLAFSKHGGNIAEKGAVAFQFDHKGMIRVKGSWRRRVVAGSRCRRRRCARRRRRIGHLYRADRSAKVRDALSTPAWKSSKPN